MKKIYRSNLLLLVLSLSALTGISQITNTKSWRKSEKDSLDHAILLYDEKNYLQAFPFFDKIYHSHPNENFLKYTYAKCALLQTDRAQDSYTLLKEIYDANKKVYNIQLDLAKAAYLNDRFDEGMQFIDAYMKNRRTKSEFLPEAEKLKTQISYAIYYSGQPTNAVVKNIGEVINTEYDEYIPNITADESMMIFTRKDPSSKGEVQEDGKKSEDVWCSYRKEDQWNKPFPMDSINTDLSERAVSLSFDGRTLLIYKDIEDDHGDIYQSFLIGDAFTKPEKIKGEVNTYSWDGHASLSPDGKTLYFASERSSGFGGKDIYRATLLADSTWANITNLGDSVNTSMDEDAPFIHADGTTLFYSSKGKPGVGGYDVYQANMDPNDSIFKTVKNLGWPINSTADDIYFVLAANGNTAYYSSSKPGGKGGQDIYLIETNFSTKPDVLLVKGKTMSNQTPVETSIQVENLNKGTVFKSLKSNPQNGEYLIILPKGTDYRITYSCRDKAPDMITVSGNNISGYVEKIHDALWDTLRVPAVPSSIPPYALLGDDWVPKTKMQEKIMKYTAKFGDIKASGLQFRIQIAAYKFPNNYQFKHLRRLGRIKRLLLNDGITRITIGPNFKTMKDAWKYNKKVIMAGQEDAFVTAVYKGKRILFEELVQMGIFVEK